MLDKDIMDGVWPGVVKAVNQRVLIPRIEPGKTPRQGIEDVGRKSTARKLGFYLDDPARPMFSAISPPWYFGGTIIRTRYECSMSFRLRVDFPSDFSIAKIMRILKEPLMRGSPPELHYCDPFFCIAFSGGAGTEWENSDSTKEWAYCAVMKNIAIIDAAIDLESDYKNTKLFNVLRRRILDVYEAW